MLQQTTDHWQKSVKDYTNFRPPFGRHLSKPQSTVLVSALLSRRGWSTPVALICNLTNTLRLISQCHLNDCCVFFWVVGLAHFLDAYRCNLSICILSRNAEWVQIAVMKLFHYGDEQCWINRNNKAECFIEPSVEVLWQRVLLCLQLWWLAGGHRWLLAKWNNSHLRLPVIHKQN